MATAADITIKKYDGTTDIVWSLLAASGGDKSPAFWRSETATGTQGQRPVFSMSARPNTAGTVRRVDFSVNFPSVYTNSSTGQTEVRSMMTFTGSFAVPQNVAAADVNEFAGQVTHLLGTTVTQVAVRTGFAPT